MISAATLGNIDFLREIVDGGVKDIHAEALMSAMTVDAARVLLSAVPPLYTKEDLVDCLDFTRNAEIKAAIVALIS
jgi:hypothetical protein